jgi:hypothetical protein
VLSDSNIPDKKHFSSFEEKLIVSHQMGFNDFYREKQGNLNRNISSFQQKTVLNSQIQFSGFTARLGAHYGLSQKNLNYDISESQSLRLHNAYREYQIFLSSAIFQDYLLVSGGIGKKILNNFEFNPWNLGATFQPTKSIYISYHRYEDFFRWEYNINIDLSTERLLADEYAQVDVYRIGLSLIPDLKISATMLNNYINRNRQADVSESILIPSGTHYQRTIRFHLFPERSLSLNLLYNNRSNDLIGYLYNSHQIFGKLTEQKDHAEFLKSEFIFKTLRHRFGLDVGLASGMMSTNGHVESWPFTSTLIDLMGLRYNFKSNLDYELFRIGTSYQYKGQDWYLSVKSMFERLSPNGGARTWEPEMIVFGVKNLNIYNLPEKYWDGLYLGIHFGKSFGDFFQLTYEFQQYIPIEFKSKKVSGKNLENANSIKKSVYGGGTHKVYFLVSL